MPAPQPKSRVIAGTGVASTKHSRKPAGKPNSATVGALYFLRLRAAARSLKKCPPLQRIRRFEWVFSRHSECCRGVKLLIAWNSSFSWRSQRSRS